MSEQRISVYLVDDHPLVLEGVKMLLKYDERINVAAQASSGPEALVQLQHYPEVQVAIIDMSMPDMTGIELTHALHERYPHVRVLVLSMDYEYSIVKEVLEAGGSGYLLKNTSREELSAAVHAIAAGQTFFSPAIGSALLQQFETVRATKQPVVLTNREHEILRLIAREYSNNDIAETLCISERTVETHRKNILVKTNSKTVIGLIQYAIRHKLLP